MRSLRLPRSHRTLGLVVATALAVLLAGCTGLPGGLLEGDRTQPTRFELEPVSVPAELQGGPTPVGTATLPPTEELPGVLAVRMSSGERAPWVQLWSIEDRTPNPVPTPEIGTDIASVDVAGDDSMSALAAVGYDNGRLEPRLYRSQDRLGWEAVEVPDELVDHEVQELAVVDGIVYVLLQGANLVEDLLAVRPDGSTGISTLPLPTDRRRSSAWHLAGHDRELVVLRSEAVPAESSRWFTYRSADAGVGWESLGETEPDFAPGVTGLLWMGEEYLMTGSYNSEDGTEAAAWSSPQATDWQAEGVTAPEEVVGYVPPGDTQIYGPSMVADGGVVAVFGCLCPGVTWAERDPEGGWEISAEESAKLTGVDVTGRAWLAADGAPAAVLSVPGVVSVAADEVAEPVVEAPRATSVLDVTRLGEVAAVTVTRPYFELYDSGGWRRGARSEGQLYDGSAITPGDWPVPELADQGALTTDAGPGEPQVALGSGDEAESITVTGHFYDGQAWSPVSGFDTAQDYHEPTAVVRTRDGWLAATLHGDLAVNSDRERSARLYSSADGQTWRQDRGGFESGVGDGSEITGLCLNRDDEPVAFGYVLDEDGTAHASSWRLDEDERWSRQDLTLDGQSYFGGCTTAEDGALLLSGESRGDQTTWRSEDGTAFTPVDLTDDRVQKDPLVQVAGGVVAGGSWVGEDYRGPVLWLSRDGEDWVAEPLPVPSGSDDVDVYAVDGELLVLATGVARTRAWRIPDIAAVMSEL